MTPNTIQFSGTDSTWVMRITADRRIEVNEDVEVTEAAQKVLDALQHLLKPAPVQEPVVWMWQQAPIKTQWGDEMVVAALAIDRDHTVSIYCERDQTAKVEAMFTPPAAQRQWVGLTEEERTEIRREHYARTLPLMDAVEAKLKEKNT